ncbi:outer membrane protein assembly factor BamD [Candidatus Pelagibacter bacterium]|nr:outer membrane protein assembly factor BamD [Candidatus Pelagibacter bacterium]
MSFKVLLALSFAIIVFSCSNSDKKIIYKPQEQIDGYKLYKEGLDAFEENDFFYASKKFSEAELNFKVIELAAKSAIMSSYSLYGINFYEEAVENLNRYLITYPADKNVIYAHYLIAVIYFEQIKDEKKDMQPLLDANKKINFFINKYPESDYAIDLKFKKDLIENQLAAKELFVAKYYVSTQKWVPAINRLKVIVNDYDKTIFIEEALHRLVEIHYYLGLQDEAKKYAKILGYNYNSGKWFEQSYKILNKNYKIKPVKNGDDDQSTKKKGFFKKIIKKIK